MPKKHRSLALTLGALALAASIASGFQYAGSKPPPAAFKAGFTAIKVDECKKWLGYLAGPECAGRGTGEPGYQKAAEYMAARFKEMGLKPGGDNGTYFQNLTFYRSRMSPSLSHIAVDGVKTAMAGNFSMEARADQDLEGEVVLVTGHGAQPTIEDAEAIKGKIVIVASDIPTLRTQVRTAQPLALFTIGKPVWQEGDWRVRRNKDAGTASSRRRRGIEGTISQEALDRIAAQLDMSMPGPAANAAENWVGLAKGSKKVQLVLKVQDEEVQVPNVIAVLPGSDPKLKNECVGLGSHLDHLGFEDGQIHWGADDDASGSTALLAVARAFTKNKTKPKRSIVFMAFCGEEMGLIGSGYQADHPVFPLENMVCELQMDMVGRNEEQRGEKPEDNVNTIHLVGSKRISTDLHNLVLDMNKHVGFNFEYDEEGVYTRSDHYMFAQKGVPIAFLFSGFHPDYHRPTDTIEKINFEKIVNTARLFYLVAANAANAPQKLRRDVKSTPDPVHPHAPKIIGGRSLPSG